MNRLDATLLDRLVVRPGWTRTTLCRRIAAALLAVLAVGLFVRDAAATDHVRVVVATRDLTPGSTLGPGDVRWAEYPPETVPDGALTSTDDAHDHTVAGPVRAGEPLTDVRLLSSRLAASTLDSGDARIVPIRLSDAGVTELLRSGDTVDVLTVGEGDDEQGARVLATSAVVVLVASESEGARERDRVVLLAMSPEDATTVAAASLISALTVTFR